MEFDAFESLMEAEHDHLLLDTRPAESFARAHLPGSVHLPEDQIASRYGEIERVHGRVIVIPPRDSRHNVEAFLREFGFDEVRTFEGGLSRWTGAVERGGPEDAHRPMPSDPREDPYGVGAPMASLRDAMPYMRPWGQVLDIACGRGRNSLHLAAEDFEVLAVDQDREAMEEGETAARDARLRVHWLAVDLEHAGEPWRPRPESCDAVVVSRYLWRPLVPHLARAVRPGGVVAYETFTTDQARFGPPRNPEHLLEPSELLRSFRGWELLSYREGPLAPPVVDSPCARASLIARRPMRAA